MAIPRPEVVAKQKSSWKNIIGIWKLTAIRVTTTCWELGFVLAGYTSADILLVPFSKGRSRLFAIEDSITRIFR